MLEFSMFIVEGALAREESRGATIVKIFQQEMMTNF